MPAAPPLDVDSKEKMSEVFERIKVRETHHGAPAAALHKGPIVGNYQSRQVRDEGSVRKRGRRDF